LKIHKHPKNLLFTVLFITSLFLTFQLSLLSNDFAASGNLGTQVGGTLTSNTTWTAANSPYIITDTIQIPENVNLTIEPGVTVTTQSPNNIMFLINGVIQANGNATNKIIFDGNGNSSFFKTNHPVAEGFVDLDYCIIRNGQSAFWLDNTAYLNLTNSDLSDLSQTSYLWYPSQDTYIEYNTFTNCAGIKIGTDDYFANSSGIVYVRYNLFTNNQGYVINNYASYGASKIIINNNSFTNTTDTILEVEKTSTTADMNASQNFWGTANTTIIDSMIYDENDDVSCSSYINYLPILDAPDPETPVAPTSTVDDSSPEPSPAPTSVPTTNPDPSATPSPTISPTDTPTTTPSPTNSTTPDSTTNPTNPTPTPTTTPNPDQNQSPSTPPTNPTQQTISEKQPTVNEPSKNYTEMIIIVLTSIALTVGLIVYFGKYKS
jgi:hypothetical protein